MDVSGPLQVSATKLFEEKVFWTKKKVVRPRKGMFRKLWNGNLISAVSRIKCTPSEGCVCLSDG